MQGAELSKTKVTSSFEGSPASGTSRSVFFFRFARLRMVAVFVSSCAGCCGGPSGGPGRPLGCGACTLAADIVHHIAWQLAADHRLPLSPSPHVHASA